MQDIGICKCKRLLKGNWNLLRSLVRVSILHGGTNEVRECIKEYLEHIRVVYTVSNRSQKMSSFHNITISYLFQVSDLRKEPIIKGVVSTDGTIKPRPSS